MNEPLGRHTLHEPALDKPGGLRMVQNTSFVVNVWSRTTHFVAYVLAEDSADDDAGAHNLWVACLSILYSLAN